MYTREQLLERLLQHTRVLHNQLVKRAFERVDRKDFVPSQLIHEAYEDYPLPIGHGQTISQPTTVAFMLELLDARQGQLVLDIGTGSGWTTALLADIVGPTGSVVGVEQIHDLVLLGTENMQKYDYDHAHIIQARQGVLGMPDSGPFDRILVSAAAEGTVPTELVKQLKCTGTMVIPVDNNVVKVEKKEDGTVIEHAHWGFVFVPLI